MACGAGSRTTCWKIDPNGKFGSFMASGPADA
jgi:hypothetical protein